MLTIDQATYDAIVAHAKRDHPDEACGVVAGPAGGDLPTRHIAMDNAARSMTFYEFDSMEQLRVWREIADNDEEPVVIYHSHTATEAYPSRTDVSYAAEPQAHYVLLSTAESWRRSFTDLRLALATRLGVEDGDEEVWAALPDEDPRAQAHDIYEWVGYLQETVVEALTS